MILVSGKMKTKMCLKFGAVYIRLLLLNKTVLEKLKIYKVQNYSSFIFVSGTNSVQRF